MKRWKWIVAGVAVLAVAAAAVLLLGLPTGPLAELASAGGDKPLREPLRPLRGGTRVLVLALDGVGENEFLQAIRSGQAPHMAAALGYGTDGAYATAHAVPDVLSILPSTTVAAWASVFTGQPPAMTGVPGNEWFAREERRFYAPAPVTIESVDDALAVYNDGLLGSVLRVPTVYELADVRSHVALSQIHRGADLLTLPDLSTVGELALAAAAGIADPSESVSQEAYSSLDAATVDHLLEAFRTHGVPDLQVVYFPGVDLYTHVAEHALPDQLRYIAEVLDPAIGRILAAYRDANLLERTWIVFVSDHGHTPVLADDRRSLGTDEEIDPPALLRRLGFRVRPFELELADDEQDFQATVAYQGAMAYVYLADRSTCPRPGDVCDWTRPPRLVEDVLEVARAFDAANRTGVHVSALLGTLDLIFAREPVPTTRDALPFDVWDGERLVPLRAYLAAHPRPDLLRLPERLEALAAGPFGHRAGDVLLLARSGLERPIEERFYFSSFYRSWHGSPAAQDSRIPLVVARAGMPAAEIRDIVTRSIGETPTQLDVTRLILALLAS